MAKSDQFKNKLRDLQTSEFEHPDDFFSRAQAMEHSSSPSPAQINVEETTVSQRLSSADEVWIDTSNEGYEGQLAVDVYQDDKFVYVQAIVGGIAPEHIEVHLNNDMLTIKGKRINPREVGDESMHAQQYYIQECYWGGFSRSIILPVDIQNDSVNANTEHGVLTITLPKSNRPKNSRIPVQEAS